jgi:hypothetical protein
VSERVLLNANSVIFQLYHDENKLIFNEMMRSTLFRDTNWEVRAGSQDKIFDKNMSICLTKL